MKWNKYYDHNEIKKETNTIKGDDFLFCAKNLASDSKFSIILPPPNVTGSMHIGHAYENTIQDFIIRYEKLQGKNCVFFPGFDHAGIAAQKKIIEAHPDQDLSDSNLFNLFAEKWVKNCKSNIQSQWQSLGLNLDYKYLQYTKSETSEKLVYSVFKHLWDNNLVYWDKKIVNHDVILGTAISDLEIENRDINTKLYYVKYFLVDNADFLTVATTRPETIFADNALLINPADAKNKKYLNQKVKNPLTNQTITVLPADFVDSDFGTGIVKSTPAHDPNDFLANEKLNLDYFACINTAGKMVNVPQEYLGLDRTIARKKVIKELEATNHLADIKDYKTSIKYSTRSNSVIEPLVSLQLFIATSKIAKNLLEEYQNQNQTINFYPKKYKNNFINWLEKMQDWCISRQISWGTRIPLAYDKSNEKYIYYDKSSSTKDLVLVKDVFDTWFNSSLWPYITIQYLQSNKELQSFFPSDLLVTGYDIILFWVARMIMQSYTFKKEIPFKNVLIHGLVRDSQNRKMSKMLNNGIDPLELINKYGADALRWYFLMNCKIGEDLRFNENKLLSSKTFLIKVYNVANLLNLFQTSFKKYKFDSKIIAQPKHPINISIINTLNHLKTEFHKNYKYFQFSVFCNDIQKFLYNDFANKYLEIAKLFINDEKINLSIRNEFFQIAFYIFYEFIAILSCICPFLAYFIKKHLFHSQSLITKSSDSKITLTDIKNSEQYTQIIWNLVQSARSITSLLKIEKTQSVSATFCFNPNPKNKIKLSNNDLQSISKIIFKLTNWNFIFADKISHDDNQLTKLPISSGVIYLKSSDFNLGENIIEYLKNEKNNLAKEILRSKKILSNNNFIKNAPPKKLEQEKQKADEYEQRFNLLNAILKLF